MTTRVITLLADAIAQGAGAAFQPAEKQRTFQVNGATSSGTGAATVKIEVSNNGSDWLTLGTVSLTLGTTSTSDGFVSDAPWGYVRANVSAISGTDAAVTVKMGV